MPTRALLSLLVPVLALLAASAVGNDRRTTRLSAELRPTSEVPSLSSTGRGRFKATLDTDNQTITYELSYEDLEAAPAQAHIHIGQRGVNGFVTLFLCGNPPSVPPAGFPVPPACPVAPATVTGVLTPDNVIPIVSQGIAALEFDEVVNMLRSGVTYANVHTSKFPTGEIRGQVRVSKH